MLYRSSEGQYPSLVVQEGQTVTIRAKDARESGIPFLNMQPRTTAALMVLAGQAPHTTPRLSDRTAFEQIDKTEGLVSLSILDQDGRVDGYSVSFIRGLLQEFDPDQRLPPKSVRRLIPHTLDDSACGCSGKRQKAEAATRAARSAAVAGDRGLSSYKAHSVRETAVPEFLERLQVFSLFMRLGDIVVERNATLILDSDISFAIADNILAYHGARVVQRSGYMYLDVTGTMRGSVFKIVHTVTDAVKINFHALAAEPSTKP